VRDYVVSNVYLYPIVIIFLTIVLAWAVLFLIDGVLKAMHLKSKKVNHRILAAIETPTIVIIVLIGMQLAIKNIISLNSHFNKLVFSLIIMLLTFVLMRLGGIILEYWSKRVSRSKGEEFHSEILPLTKSVLSIILSIIGVILILQVWNVEIAALVTSLGIAGVILGFAFRQTLENIFGGIGLIMDNSFRQGDLIQLEDGEMGEIIEINLRSTKLRNFDSEIVIVPNALLANKKITNFAQPTPTMRLKIPVSVAYGSDVDLVKEVLHDSLSGHKHVLTMPRRVARFESFGESGLNFTLFFHIKNYEEMYTIKDEIITQVYKDLYANNIEIPFPIRTIVPAKKGQYKQKWKNPKRS